MPQLLYRKIKNNALIALAIMVFTVGFAITSYAQYNNMAEEAEVPSLIYKIILKNGLGAGGLNGRASGIRFSQPAAMEEFYGNRENRPVWTSQRGEIEDIVEILEASWTHGLNPDNYHVKQIRQLMESRFTDKARLELVVTDAVMRYGHDITGMRFDPKEIKQNIDYWRAPLAGQEVMAQLSSSSNPSRVLANMAPSTDLYKALQNELVRLSQDEIDYDRVLPMSFGGNHHFTPGRKHKDVAALRVRLDVSYRSEYGSESFYDDNTAAAVMKFQREHGLEPDGIIGPQTLSVLNRTKQDRMEQIVANLERLRWLDQEKPDRYFLVNIPQQLLWAVEDGRVAHEMKVVVGLPYRRTKEFKTEVTGVRFNPNWTVPLNLKMKDFKPKLIDDPTYLSQKGIEVIRGYGSNAETLDPESIDWEEVGWKEMNTMRFVQSPGDHNALGAIRILMPNKYNIYMHDTNHPEYFERGQRTYSSGCIRLSEPEKVANFVLGSERDWSSREMEDILETGKTTEVMTSEPFPAYIIYQTIWLDDRGRIVYGPDVYKRDRELIEVLAKMDGYKLPDMDTRYASIEGSSDTALAYNN